MSCQEIEELTLHEQARQMARDALRLLKEHSKQMARSHDEFERMKARVEKRIQGGRGTA